MGSKRSLGNLAFGFLLGFFFVSSLILSVGVPDMYNSPDERAVAVSIASFVETGTFSVEEPLNETFDGLLAPRSMVAVGTHLVPITFPGLSLIYGVVGKITSIPFTKWLTSVLAVLAILAWRKVLECFLSRRAALIGAVLFLTLSGFWFYTARAFMHNVPFLAFFVFGLFFLAWRPFGRKTSKWATHPIERVSVPFHVGDALLAGLMLGLALLFRTSELVWMTIVGFIFLVAFGRVFTWKTILLFLVAMVIAVAPFFVWNQMQFGDPWRLGYTVSAPAFSLPELSDQFPVIVGTSDTSHAFLSQWLFPFGFHPRLAWRTFVDYQLELTWWMTALSILGLAFMVFPRRENPRETKILRTILLVTFVAGGYLTIFYGSWNIADNPDPGAVTLANSYVRYWLPIYLVSTIPSALFIDWLASRARTLFSQRLVIGSVLLLVSFLSIRLVFFHPDDGLVRTRGVLLENIEIRDELLTLTEPDSVIIVDYADKILFPHRRVVVPLRTEATYDALPHLVENLPTYYFGITLPDGDFDHLNQAILQPRGLIIEPVTTINIETLYRIYAKSS